MQKIPTMFVRDEQDRRYVIDQVAPGSEWVAAGQGRALRKLDGTCVMLDDNGAWWARREVKPGKTPPPSFVPIHTDDATQKTVGWEPIAQSAFAKYHAEAVGIDEDGRHIPWTPGTFELIGPKINGNPEKRAGHTLVRHSTAEEFAFTDRSYTELRRILLFLHASYGYEGVVFHHSDGIRLAKLKARDFKP